METLAALATVLAALAPLAALAMVSTVLATLGVADLYRARQARRFRVVVYPIRPRKAARRPVSPAWREYLATLPAAAREAADAAEAGARAWVRATPSQERAAARFARRVAS